MLRKLLLSIAITALSVFPISPSQAHSAGTTFTPAADSKVLAMPSVVSIEFNGKLLTLSSKDINLITVTDPSGQVISDGISLVEGRKISTKISILDSTGLMSVHYRIVSGDGHPVEGEYSFTVGDNLKLVETTDEESDKTVYRAEEEPKNWSFAEFLPIIIAAITAFIIIRRNSKR